MSRVKSNFSFLQTEWKDIFQDSHEAEKLVLASPKASAILARGALETAVNWLFDNDYDLTRPYDRRLATLLHEQCFRDLIHPTMFRELDLIRRAGNNAAHGQKVNSGESLAAIKNLFRFLAFLSHHYSRQKPEIPTFDESLLSAEDQAEKSHRELDAIKTQLIYKSEQAKLVRKEYEKQISQIAELKQQVESQRTELKTRRIARDKELAGKPPVPVMIPESATRRLYIDLSLKESGWDNLQQDQDIEYEVRGMPLSTNPSGIGYADYVLWGDDGLPLAVIEAKRTLVDARKGRHQAELYADCLEAMHGQRPVIFYTNGFETFIWDDQFYIDREIQGFYTKDELQLTVNRRKSRMDIREFKVDTKIVERPYQLEAVARVAESLATTNPKGKLVGKGRTSLLVMATGSGKTRTAIAIVDMLTKYNWVKRVLFLADRNALVTQAKNAFGNHLPNLSSIDLTKEKEDSGTRLVFSTYPTIMNRIDSVKTEDSRFYGVGHFDLIIIDEAHRSVYMKYRAIFEYFDSLLIGLTATPKKDIDHNTYQLFEIEDDNPTSAYELNAAVADGYLVPARAIEVPVKFQREGIKYADLSDKEKEEWEQKFGDPSNSDAPDEITGSAVNRWLFNSDTVDKVLDHLMTNGIKVQGGDKLGKTILFAKNHNHATFIEERFNKNYPEYSGKFLRVIDNYETKAQDLLERFVDHHVEKDPQVAVSVDMMDTGVDAPRVVNLVFFKIVRSPTKFWQMIGRGTRLCPDLFGPGKDKEHFLIFDYCENFEFFDATPDGFEAHSFRPLTQQIFEAKLDIALLVRAITSKTGDDETLSKTYIDSLHNIISNLDHKRFVVRKELRYVTEFAHRDRWDNISKNDVQEIKTHLSNLSIPDTEDELARRFDLLLLHFQLLHIAEGDTTKYINNIAKTAKALLKKQTIPAVARYADLLQDLTTDIYWQGVSLTWLEEIRKSLRDLIKFLDRDKQGEVYTNFEDELKINDSNVRDVIPGYTTLKSYHDRVESFIRKNLAHPTIKKLNTNVPITQTDLDQLEKILFDGSDRGTRQDYIREYGNKPLGIFIRSIVGLDKNAANAVFSKFLQKGNLRADQMTFINNIITHLTKNGTIDKQRLFEPPFTDVNDQGLVGVFDDGEARQIVLLIDQVNGNVVAV